jgi:hypothetical protein
MATIRQASTGKERAFYAAIEGATRDVLQAVGWRPEEGAGGTIWLNPIDRHWYDNLRAIAVLKGGTDPGGSD